MIFVYGRKTARIKKFTDSIGACTSCGATGLDFEIYRDYFHLFWVPFFPVGEKESKVHCTRCGQPNNYNPRVNHFEAVTRTPIYLFSGPLLIVGLIVTLVIGNINTQKQKALFVSEPKIGDVYTMYKRIDDTTNYYFLRVASIHADTVVVYPNVFRYFRYPTSFHADDYFVTDAFFYTKAELKQLLEKGEINSVERGYSEQEGFNRIKTFVPDSIQ